MIKNFISFRFFFILVGIMFVIPNSVKAYSVLTHEALIDASWEKSILPLLKLKYPASTEDDLNRVEIAFDVLEISRGNYASQNYHNFIGFQVSRPVLERAFLKTYGQDINVVFGDLGLTIATFRWSIKSLLPTITHIAWEIKKRDIRLKNPSANSRNFHYKMSKKQYYAEFGKARQRPGLKAMILSGLVRVLPKIGPLSVLRFKDVGPEGEKLFIRSFDTTLVHYASALNKLHTQKALIPDVDYDTGKPTLMGEYDLADKTYGELVIKLEETKFNNLTAPLKQNILNYYSKTDSTSLSKIDPKQWKKTYQYLQTLKVAQTFKNDSLKNAKGEYYKLNEPVAMPVTGK